MLHVARTWHWSVPKLVYLLACTANKLSYLASPNHTYHSHTPYRTLLKIKIESAEKTTNCVKKKTILIIKSHWQCSVFIVIYFLAWIICRLLVSFVFTFNINLIALVNFWSRYGAEHNRSTIFWLGVWNLPFHCETFVGKKKRETNSFYGESVLIGHQLIWTCVV